MSNEVDLKLLEEKVDKIIELASMYVRTKEGDVSFSKEEAELIVNEDPSISYINGKLAGLGWWAYNAIIKRITKYHLFKNPQWEKTGSYKFLFFLSKEKTYSSFDIFDRLMESDNNNHKYEALSKASPEALHKALTGGPTTPSIRLSIYEQLGKDYIEEMLKDKSWKVRLYGAELAPYNFPYLHEMEKERSWRVLKIIIQKLPKEKVIFFFGNKKIKNKEVQRAVEDKMREI